MRLKWSIYSALKFGNVCQFTYTLNSRDKNDLYEKNVIEMCSPEYQLTKIYHKPRQHFWIYMKDS